MTDDEVRESVREHFKYVADKQHVEAMANDAVRRHHERLAEEDRLKELRLLPTWEDDTHPHDPWSGRCMGCGRWTIQDPQMGDSGYGPYWMCPTPCGVRWDALWHWGFTMKNRP